MFQQFKSLVAQKVMLKKMQQNQPLPLGMAEFEVWSNRIIAAAMIGADIDSQKFALADMILHLGATEDHKPDAFFIKMLRKVAVNQIADAKRKQIRDIAKARLEAQEKAASEAAKPHAEVTATTDGITQNVLGNASL